MGPLGVCTALAGLRAAGTGLNHEGAGSPCLSVPFLRSVAEALAGPSEKQKENSCLLHNRQQCPLFFSVFPLKEVVGLGKSRWNTEGTISLSQLMHLIRTCYQDLAGELSAFQKLSLGSSLIKTDFSFPGTPSRLC